MVVDRIMEVRDRLIQELKNLPESLLLEVLRFLQFLKGRSLPLQELSKRLAAADVVSLRVQPRCVPGEGWVDFREDPQWDEFQEAIAAYRRELDAELAEEYRQMDEADQNLQSGPSAAKHRSHPRIPGQYADKLTSPQNFNDS